MSLKNLQEQKAYHERTLITCQEKINELLQLDEKLIELWKKRAMEETIFIILQKESEIIAYCTSNNDADKMVKELNVLSKSDDYNYHPLEYDPLTHKNLK